jgi:exosortase/archaeosortase family protein
MKTDSPEDSAPVEKQKTASSPPPSRRRVIAFVATFLVSAFAMLAGYRYAVRSELNLWYLYQVAKHTSWTLDLLGHSSRLENARAYQGQEAQMRLEIEAWRQGRPAPQLPFNEKSEPHRPLTAWEIWLHRIFRAIQDERGQRERIAFLEPVPRGEFDAAQEHVDYLRNLLDRLTKAENHPILHEKPQRTGKLPPQLAQVKAALDRVEGSLDDTTGGTDQELIELDRRLSALREEEYARTKKQLALDAEFLEEPGPTVHFVAEPGLDRLIDEKEETLAALRERSNGNPTAEQTEALQKEIDQLRERKLAEEEKGKTASNEKSFSFHLVPACGAIESMAIYVAAILAFPALLWKRLAGIVIGLPILYAVNVLRLVTLAFIAAYTGAGKWFDFSHLFVWQGVYLIFVVCIWLAWVEFIVRRKETE